MSTAACCMAALACRPRASCLAPLQLPPSRGLPSAAPLAPATRSSYVLAGGSSKRVLRGLQQAACSWRAADYTAAAVAELGWALASASLPPPGDCLSLLQDALQGDLGGRGGQDDAGEASSDAERAGLQQEVQLPPPAQQRDWGAWVGGAPPRKQVLLLWAAARLDCPPCAACMDAVAAALVRRDSGLAELPTKVRLPPLLGARRGRCCVAGGTSVRCMRLPPDPQPSRCCAVAHHAAVGAGHAARRGAHGAALCRKPPAG